MTLTLGADKIMALESYVGIGAESTWGTYATSTAQLLFESASLTKKRTSKVIEEIVSNSSRTYQSRVNLGIMVDGEISFNYRADCDACNLFLINGLGGAVASATISAAASYLHTIDIGDMDFNTNSSSSTIKGLSLNMRKGDGNTGKVFEYHGLRVNELMFNAEIDETLKVNAGLIGKDSTQNSNDISANLTCPDENPLIFTDGRISVELTTTSLLTTASWHVQSAEWGITNNLKGDTESRRIGSETLDVLPPSVANLTLNVNMRFDTVTAYNAFMDGTKYSAEIEFTGATLAGSTLQRYVNFRMPKLYIREGAEPEIGGPDEILTTNIVFDVLCDSCSGYSMQAKVQNGTENY